MWCHARQRYLSKRNHWDTNRCFGGHVVNTVDCKKYAGIITCYYYYHICFKGTNVQKWATCTQKQYRWVDDSKATGKTYRFDFGVELQYIRYTQKEPNCFPLIYTHLHSHSCSQFPSTVVPACTFGMCPATLTELVPPTSTPCLTPPKA